MKQENFVHIVLNSRLKYYIIPLAFILSVFFIIPFELYYNAQVYWNWEKGIPLNFAITGIGLYGVILLFIYFLFKIKQSKTAKYISLLLSLLGIFILLADVFSPLQTNQATGAELISSEPFIYTTIEMLLFVFIIVIALKAKLEKSINITVVSTGLLLVISCVYVLLVLNSSKPVIEAYSRNKDSNISGNVYHFVLDEMQTDAALIYLNEKDDMMAFPGFTIYKNNTSNYMNTLASFPSYLTGTVFKDQYFKDWQENFKHKGLLRGLSQKGYNIIMYPPSYEWLNPYASLIKSLDDIFLEEIGLAAIHSRDFIQIWFARTMPNFLTNESLRISRAIFKGWSYCPSIDDKIKKIPLTFEEGKSAFASVLMLKRLIREEKNRPANGQYIYAHAMLPHTPFVMNEKSEYQTELRSAGVVGYYEQTKCVLNLLTDFFIELKRLGRYKNSTVIIHSDTGHGPLGFIKKEDGRLSCSANMIRGRPSDIIINVPENETASSLVKEIVRRPTDFTIARIMSILMLKPSNNTNNQLEISEKLTQLIDIVPTLSELLKLNIIESELDGYSVYSNKFPKDRQPCFFWSWKEKKYSDFIKASLSDPKNISESKLIVNDIVKKFLSKEIQGKPINYDIGSSKENGLDFEGFSQREGNESANWRWGTGKRNKIIFKGFSVQERTKLQLNIFVKPFLTNEDRTMTLATSLSSAKVKLKPGMNQYSVSLEFPKGENPSIDIYYDRTASPKSLGLGSDKRELSVLWSEIEIIMLK